MYIYIYVYIYSTLLGNFGCPLPQVSSIACPSKRQYIGTPPSGLRLRHGAATVVGVSDEPIHYSCSWLLMEVILGLQMCWMMLLKTSRCLSSINAVVCLLQLDSVCSILRLGRLKCTKGQNGSKWWNFIDVLWFHSVLQPVNRLVFVKITSCSTSTSALCYTDYTGSFFFNGIMWPCLRRIESRNCTIHASNNLLTWCHPG
jgi:hypothetical protein